MGAQGAGVRGQGGKGHGEQVYAAVRALRACLAPRGISGTRTRDHVPNPTPSRTSPTPPRFKSESEFSTCAQPAFHPLPSHASES
jgi:hypothetical protein